MIMQWQSVANACVPSTQSAGKYATIPGGGISFASGQVGTIQLVGDIQDWLTNEQYKYLELLYTDSTGTGTSAHVNAYLFRAHKNTGVAAQIASVRSDNGSAPGTRRLIEDFTHTYDFINYYYYIVVELNRSSTSETVAAYFVRVYGTSTQEIIFDFP